jgi:hypothetical protein
MHGADLYRKYRERIEELADEACSTQLSLATLRGLLQEFEREAAALTQGAGHFISSATRLPTNSSMRPFTPPAGIGGMSYSQLSRDLTACRSPNRSHDEIT